MFEQVFSLGNSKFPKVPILAINSLETETLQGEQKGFLNLLKESLEQYATLLVSEPKIEWKMSEEDALDIMSTISLVHRKLDKAKLHNPGE